MPYQVAHASNSRIPSHLLVAPYRLQEQVQEKRRQERRRNRPGPSVPQHDASAGGRRHRGAAVKSAPAGWRPD